ncbi:ATP-binding protein [Fusobacterium gastrosuis]|uniref:ATP-binding protein n=1 Tax=Fusobacterium gastrosuis TaxID=1755100 RepID=UPI0029791E23|nr:ATP-binding protein [Fusobacteriaceae bacterium]MDY5714019.1 ATP-binding protein [Fusobacterium gastrosuis]
MIERKTYIEQIKPFINTDLIKVLTGIRRSGKSILLKLLIEEIKKMGINSEQIINLNFEDIKNKRLCTAESLNDFILSEAKKGEKNYLFLDEIQEVENWEKVINSLRIQEEYNFDIFITGSNAKLLSGELATYLAGRYVEFKIFPFSFSEFYVALEEQQENNKITKDEAFKQYIKFGGMPFLYNLKFNYPASMQYLADIYSSIILKDITQRNKIRDIDLLERIIKYILANIGNTFSANSLVKFFKSENRKVAIDTILNYIKFCEEAMLIYRVERYDLLGKKILTINEKYYIADHGIREAILESNERDINQVFENIIHLELLRRGYKVKIGKINELEIDFICEKNSNEKIYIQVAYLLASEETLKREFTPLEKIGDNFPKYIISYDQFDFSKNGINHINIVDFLLEKI